MNVIKFTFEIKKRYNFLSKKNIVELVNEKIKAEFSDTQYLKKCRDKWEQLDYSGVKSLKPKNSIHSFYTEKNVQIFAFSYSNQKNELVNDHSITLEIIAIGDMTVDNLLNISFKKLVNVYNSFEIYCKHIGETRIYIFPFSTENKDIYSYDLKIRAQILKPFGLGKNDIIKWILFAFILVGSGIYYFTIKDSKDQEALKNILLSVIGSSIFFILTDVILLILLPLITRGKSRIVQINDLSSVVETNPNILTTNNQSETLTIPE